MPNNTGFTFTVTPKCILDIPKNPMLGASNVEFHLQSNSAMVAQQCLAGHVRSGPAHDTCVSFITNQSGISW